MGDYDVSIIHINSSTIAISIVEPQDDADTFINSCGETGEKPAIKAMITINDIWVNAQVNNDVVKKVNIEVIRAATRATNDADKSVVDYLAEFAIDDADIMDDGVIDDD